MKPSVSHQPDLDWSQVRETIKLLAVSVAQVESSMKIGDESVDVLAGSFANMVKNISSVRDVLRGLEPSEQRDQALNNCLSALEEISTSIIAFQFYDRLQQCLSHVSSGLKGLSTIIDTPERLYNPSEWHKFQTEIRGHYTMESEKAMFDAILHGKSIEEALALAESFKPAQDNEDDIELF